MHLYPTPVSAGRLRFSIGGGGGGGLGINDESRNGWPRWCSEKLLLLQNKVRDTLADTRCFFAMEDKVITSGLVAEITLLRALRARGDRILQIAGSRL